MEEKLRWCQTGIKAISHKAFGSWKLKRDRGKKKNQTKTLQGPQLQNPFKPQNAPPSDYKYLVSALSRRGRLSKPFPKEGITWRKLSFPETSEGEVPVRAGAGASGRQVDQEVLDASSLSFELVRLP